MAYDFAYFDSMIVFLKKNAKEVNTLFKLLKSNLFGKYI